jgi:hypothetical protein
MALAALAPFIGTWDMEARFAPERGVPEIDGDVTTTFEWVLNQAFLLQRSNAPDPIPQGLCIIGEDQETGAYTQHYFDSRGVARLYAMTFDGVSWTLERLRADFTPLDFSQRYIGTFADDGSTIRGAWEFRNDGEPWQTDFELSYHRRSGSIDHVRRSRRGGGSLG